MTYQINIGVIYWLTKWLSEILSHIFTYQMTIWVIFSLTKWLSESHFHLPNDTPESYFNSPNDYLSHISTYQMIIWLEFWLTKWLSESYFFELSSLSLPQSWKHNDHYAVRDKKYGSLTEPNMVLIQNACPLQHKGLTIHHNWQQYSFPLHFFFILSKISGWVLKL